MSHEDVIQIRDSVGTEKERKEQRRYEYEQQMVYSKKKAVK